MNKRTAGAALIGAAVLLVVVAGIWWSKQSSDLEYDHEVWELEVVMGARLGNPPPDEPEAKRTGPVALGVLAAVLFIGGVILVAAPPDVTPPDEPESSDHP